MRKIIQFLLILIFSGSVFADSYPVVSLYTIGSLQSSTAQGVCDLQGALKKSQNNQLYDTWSLSTPTNCRTYNITGAESNNYPISVIKSCPGGGTVSGDICTGSPDCVAPEVRNSETHLCFLCPSAGTLADISAYVGLDESTPLRIDGQLVIEITSDSTSKFQASSGGVDYEYTGSDYADDCFKNSTATGSKVFCNYHAKATGTCGSTSLSQAVPLVDPPAATNVAVAGGTAPGSPDGGCLTDSKGNTVCKSNPVGNRKCGKVNGSEVCIDTTPGTGTVNGKPYQTSDKNCGYVNGKPVCVSNDGTSATTVGCVQNGGVRQCVNSDVRTTSTSQTTANPDGTTTNIKTKETNVIGDTGGTTTTTTGANGDTTTTTTGSGGDGTGSGSGKADVNCDRYPDTLGCQKMDNGEVFKPDADLVHSTVNAGFSPVGGFSSNGSCPAPKTFTAFGQSYSFPWDPLCSFASQMRPIMVIVASIVALLIIFSVA